MANYSGNNPDSARDMGNAAIRMGKMYSTLPYCLRKLPENQPRNRQEYMIRKWMNPGEIDVYFDGSNRFLYEAKAMAQQLEEIKQDRLDILRACREQAKFLKGLIEDKPTAPPMDLVSMRERYDRAVDRATKGYIQKHKNLTN